MILEYNPLNGPLSQTNSVSIPGTTNNPTSESVIKSSFKVAEDDITFKMAIF